MKTTIKKCRKCRKNPVDTRIGDGSIWCRQCNERYVKEVLRLHE